jgi:hypothetical protein
MRKLRLDHIDVDLDDESENLDHPACIRQLVTTENNIDRHETECASLYSCNSPTMVIHTAVKYPGRAKDCLQNEG